MGFIDYHGTKEDRYSEVLDYARSQQEEDWKYKQSVMIRKWLKQLSVDKSMADMNIQDILKIVIVKYRELWEIETFITEAENDMNGLSSSQLWKDFSLDLIRRHIEPFHIKTELQNKHFDIFLTKIFKISDSLTAENFYKKMGDDGEYRRYLIENFDPTWKDQLYYRYLFSLCGHNCSGNERIIEFLNTLSMLGVCIALYLHHALHPRDNGWMMQETAEWNALKDIEDRTKEGKLKSFIKRGIKSQINGNINHHMDLNRDSETEKSISRESQIIDDKQKQTRKYEDIEIELPQSKLRKKEFQTYLEGNSIPAYVNACLLLVECDLPDEVKENYNQLIARMPVLKDSIDKFDDIYHVDMDQFLEYFAPETLRLTSTYLDYKAVQPSETILQETEENVLIATNKLLQVVNEKIEEIYKYVTIETKAEAKALEAIMSQDGYVDTEFKLMN